MSPEEEEEKKKKNAAALGLQTVARRWTAISYVRWLYCQEAATALCKAARGFLARRRTCLLLLLGHRAVVPAAALVVARFVQTRRRRDAFMEQLRSGTTASVVEPAQRCLVRFGRRCLCELLFSKTSAPGRRRDASKTIQRHARGRLARLMPSVGQQHERSSAIYNAAKLLVRCCRGHLDRRLSLSLEVQKGLLKDAENLEIAQARARGSIVLKRELPRRQRVLIKAVKDAQRAWRSFLSRRRAFKRHRESLRRRQSRAALKIQSRQRGLLAWRSSQVTKREVSGRRLLASRVILRAWLRCMAVARYKKLEAAWQVERAAKLLLSLEELRGAVLEDLQDALADARIVRQRRRRVLKRLAALQDFRSEAELRLPKIEEQIEMLTEMDVEAGWSEALDSEWDRLGSQLSMALEETRLLESIASSGYSVDLVKLQLESEDVQVDLDDIEKKEQEQLEALRRLEVKAADTKQAAIHNRRVRLESARWKV